MDRYRILVKDLDGFSHSSEKYFNSVREAITHAKDLTSDVNFVESVTLYLLLTSDSCGPIRYIGYYEYGDL